MEGALKLSGHSRNDFYAFTFNVLDPVSEARMIRDFNAIEWALLPEDIEPDL